MKRKPLDWSERAAWKAIREGNGSALLKNLKRASNLPAALLSTGQMADLVRRDPRHGRALLFVADFMFDYRIKDIYRALPTIAIAAARAHHGKGTAAKEHAATVLAKLAAILGKGPALPAEQIAVMAVELFEERRLGPAKDLYEVARGHRAAAKIASFAKLAKRFER